ncbi:hypothetical protein HPP92_020831 [Vanilla planifolia]|uniref:Uncharacterized protein n=1 Tax=Vanilla planifolia TaxID=51239 RepID=A0A835Q0K2_VANPL|nr:hypothetical protein HPP92_021174 [Vanilla planifolia]KAG0462355.1 hypothetical protein HPP92_020831 [Vanilla planifolia]
MARRETGFAAGVPDSATDEGDRTYTSPKVLDHGFISIARQGSISTGASHRTFEQGEDGVNLDDDPLPATSTNFQRLVGKITSAKHIRRLRKFHGGWPSMIEVFSRPSSSRLFDAEPKTGADHNKRYLLGCLLPAVTAMGIRCCNSQIYGIETTSRPPQVAMAASYEYERDVLL